MPDPADHSDAQFDSRPDPPAFADVLVPRRVDGAFTYAIPAALRPRLRVGSLVLVPFGPASVLGVVVSLDPPCPQVPRARPLRDIHSLLDRSPELPGIPETLLELTRQVSRACIAPWGQCLRLVLPRTTKRRTQDDRPPEPPRAPVRPPVGSPAPDAPAWWPGLLATLDARRHAAYLLDGPTPARWTILLDAAEQSLVRRRPVLVIAPEQASAAALADLARARWGDRVVLLHGGLSKPAHTDAWWRIREGAADVVIGTRSAVFAPLPSLGLIWVDDEDDPSLKEEQEPHYHTREVAWLRARQQGAGLLLSSAHPSMDSLQAVPSAARARLAASGSAARPVIEVVDLRALPPGTLFSESLLAGLRTALDAKTGAILFLNRKGFAPALLCRDCGDVPRCRRCSVPLTFYRAAGRLACHYCGATLPLPDTCPSCLAPRLEPIGFGTERLEAELRRAFPQARIARLDRDCARTPAQAAALRRQAAAGAVDLLVGTQMLFQGPPLPPVGFIGLPHADADLHLPDFRAAERLYHTLLDAVGLARPAAEGGHVLLQTRLPGQHAIAAVVNGNPAQFVEPELAFRRALGYPPATGLIALHVTGKDKTRVEAAAADWASLLVEASHRDLELLGPIPAPVAVVRSRHRWQILVKSENREAARQAVEAALEQMKRRAGRSVRLDVDVDPVEMV